MVMLPSRIPSVNWQAYNLCAWSSFWGRDLQRALHVLPCLPSVLCIYLRFRMIHVIHFIWMLIFWSVVPGPLGSLHTMLDQGFQFCFNFFGTQLNREGACSSQFNLFFPPGWLPVRFRSWYWRITNGDFPLFVTLNFWLALPLSDKTPKSMSVDESWICGALALAVAESQLKSSTRLADTCNFPFTFCLLAYVQGDVVCISAWFWRVDRQITTLSRLFRQA